MLFALFAATTARADVEINEQNFPDENFRNCLLGQSYGEDGLLTDEEIKEIHELDVSGNSISSLKGIGFFTALWRLDCSNNRLTELDVSGCRYLSRLDCSRNQIKGEGMDQLVNSLTLLLSLAIRPLVVYNSTASDEGNVCTKSQVAAIRAKNWFAYYYPDEDGAAEMYDGSEDKASVIGGVQADGVGAPLHNLSGQRVTQPKSGEIYVRNGRKVLQK